MNSTEGIVVFVVYENATDFPGEFVVRAHRMNRDGEVKVDEALATRGNTLDVVQRFLALRGLVRLDRMADDEPQIVETWI